MKVKHCRQVFSRSVATAMTLLAELSIGSNHPSAHYLDPKATDTADLFLFLDELFDSLNTSQIAVHPVKEANAECDFATTNVAGVAAKAKKMLAQVECPNCRGILESSDDRRHNIIIKHREYVMGARHLSRPFTQFFKAFRHMANVIFFLLPKFVTSYGIRKKIIDHLRTEEDIGHVFCAEHQENTLLTRKVFELERKLLERHIEEDNSFVESFSTPTAKISPPNYDGTTAREIYKTQFEAAANANHWTEQQKATSLVMALRGKAAELLQSLTTMDQGNYAVLVHALQLRFGNERKETVFQTQLRMRQQKSGESLQELEGDIERLTHLA
ncbi:hypothetical protein HUJ05_001840 [Dendroctonus ponderosae]|nr:hypothetical protein HUJ05_001840 [Dendroctonus ponderosae]